MLDDDEEEEYDDDMPMPELDYETMKQAIKYERQNTASVSRFTEGVADLRQNISDEIGNSKELIKEMFTPAFMRRIKDKKKFHAKVAASER
jgi:hypothetical protein